jgi:hypothetical protein
MGVQKGTDNFKLYRAGKQQGTIEVLAAELGKAQRRKMPYKDKATLVTDMADRTKIHRTTLVRNPLYHRLILEFLVLQAGGSSFVSVKDAPPELLRAKLIDVQMELGRLRNQLDKSTKDNSIGSIVGGAATPQLTESATHAAFSDTVWVLREILDRLNVDGEVMVVDLERYEILDLSAAPGRRCVSSGSRVRPFIDAYKRLRQQEGLS